MTARKNKYRTGDGSYDKNRRFMSYIASPFGVCLNSMWNNWKDKGLMQSSSGPYASGLRAQITDSEENKRGTGYARIMGD